MPDPRAFIPGLVQLTVAATDGTPLAVQIVDDHGGTRPTLMLINGLGGTIVTYTHLVRRFRGSFRIVCFDTRGLHGSGRPVGGADALDIPAHASDVIAVADAVSAHRFHALGWSMGVQVILEAARRLQWTGEGERIQSLTLHNGTAGRAFAEVLGQPRLAPLVGPLLSGLARVDGAVEQMVARFVTSSLVAPAFMRAGLLHTDVDRAVFGAAAAGFADLDVAIFLRILQGLGRHDAWSALPSIRTPSVVIAGRKDLLTPLTTMARMAQTLPDCRLEILDGGTHYAAIEMPRPFNDALERFWRDAGVDLDFSRTPEPETP